VAPDIEGLQSLAKEFNLLLIEDNAHGLGGSYKGRPLGSFGDFATQSFHATKNIQCGEGGAFVINNPTFIKRAEIIREKGTNRSEFIRGEVQKYQWVDQGSSYLLAEILAAQLLGQLENFQVIQKKRQQLFDFYARNLASWAEDLGYESPFLRLVDANPAHMFYLVAHTKEERDRFIKKMSRKMIQVMFHYQSLADSRFGSRYTERLSQLKVTQKVSNQLVRLPLYYNLDFEKQAEIVELMIE
jgi:dTDP-4-amino-4,6-dideoxygalactose transaminase